MTSVMDSPDMGFEEPPAKRARLVEDFGSAMANILDTASERKRGDSTISELDTEVSSEFQESSDEDRSFERDQGTDDEGSEEYKEWADGLFFSMDREGKEQLLDVDGKQIMMAWEKPYMEECVDVLEIDSSCNVLEVGFGCGYSANEIQKRKPRRHVICECSETVLKRLRVWAADRPNVTVVEGTWQRMLPSLGIFDRVFFDDYGCPGLADREMIKCPNDAYINEYKSTDQHFEAFLNMVLEWHSRPGTRITGYMISRFEIKRRDVLVDYMYTPVVVPDFCDYFFSNRATVPLFVKIEPGYSLDKKIKRPAYPVPKAMGVGKGVNWKL